MKQEMLECEFLEKCPMFVRFEIEAMGSAYIRLYCKGPMMGDCARAKIMRTGEKPPDPLLPNGKFL